MLVRKMQIEEIEKLDNLFHAKDQEAFRLQRG